MFLYYIHIIKSQKSKKNNDYYWLDNIFNLAIEGNFDECQKIVKEMFADDKFRERINMSGVNSINWARIICQVVYYFYCYFKSQKNKFFGTYR